MLPTPVSMHRITVTSNTDDDNDDDSSHVGLIQAHINLQTGLVDDDETDIRSLYPTRSINQRDIFKTLQQCMHISNRMICDFYKDPGHPVNQCLAH